MAITNHGGDLRRRDLTRGDRLPACLHHCAPNLLRRLLGAPAWNIDRLDRPEGPASNHSGFGDHGRLGAAAAEVNGEDVGSHSVRFVRLAYAAPGQSGTAYELEIFFYELAPCGSYGVRLYALMVPGTKPNATPARVRISGDEVPWLEFAHLDNSVNTVGLLFQGIRDSVTAKRRLHVDRGSGNYAVGLFESYLGKINLKAPTG